MLLPARRVVHAATQTTRVLRRSASTDSTASELILPRLQKVESLASDPSVLRELVTATSKLPVPQDRDGVIQRLDIKTRLLTLFCQNPSVLARWTYTDRLLRRWPGLDKTFPIAIQPSHAEAVKALFRAPRNTDLPAKTFRRIMNVRYADAPFISLDHVLRIGELVSLDIAVGYWLLLLPEQLVRLGTDWERPLSDVDAARQEMVRQLHSLEEKHPALMTNRGTHDALMWAYGATRVAPDDALRHWSAVLARGEPYSIRTAERALASTRDLDTLERVWVQVQEVIPRRPEEPDWMPIIDVFYAQNLTRLGARDAALALAKQYPPHVELAWLLGIPPDADANEESRAAVTAYAEHAEQLARNGLDLEDVLIVMSMHAPQPFREAIRGEKTQPRDALRTAESK
ncbi:hypothetical protein EXIGLDRAFT_727882 [Exidia glandulosa HHB12029]|uniref:Uncharacterized protein n=1 Tax=Exidia glandulosa HHB12029 TaxID=1314781 RepID=A0A165LYK5_EXIGL|nr:hypothetical protein EXIGLDRAFT_727882 [Exidia glandulosa HHB12029]